MVRRTIFPSVLCVPGGVCPAAGAEAKKGTAAGEKQVEKERSQQAHGEGIGVVVVVLVFTVSEQKLKVFLVRGGEAGEWRLPESPIRPLESAQAAAVRILEDCEIPAGTALEQLYTFSDPADIRQGQRVITLAYYALVPAERIAGAAEHSGSGALFAVSGRGEEISPEQAELAGQGRILETAVRRMRGRLDYTDLAFSFLSDPQAFTLRDLQQIHEAIRGEQLDTANFRRGIFRRYLRTGRMQQVPSERMYRGRRVSTYRVCPAEAGSKNP